MRAGAVLRNDSSLTVSMLDEPGSGMIQPAKPEEGAGSRCPPVRRRFPERPRGRCPRRADRHAFVTPPAP
jgi:hypothetical protein